MKILRRKKNHNIQDWHFSMIWMSRICIQNHTIIFLHQFIGNPNVKKKNHQFLPNFEKSSFFAKIWRIQTTLTCSNRRAINHPSNHAHHTACSDEPRVPRPGGYPNTWQDTLPDARASFCTRTTIKASKPSIPIGEVPPSYHVAFNCAAQFAALIMW